MTTARNRRTREGRSANGWRTLRVFVELPSRGDYTEGDLAAHVRNALAIQNFPASHADRDQNFGTLRVLRYSRKAPHLKETP